MNKQEILDFITKNPIVYMATVEGSTPHVRAMGTYRADADGIVFSTQAGKDVYNQLVANPATELCYFADGVQVRVAGKMDEIKDKALLDELVEARPFLKPQIEEHGPDFVKIFFIKNGKATVLDMKAGPPAPGVAKEWIDL